MAGIAIEATANPVVNYLAWKGFSLYLINPKLSKNWRACNSVAGVKSDKRNGVVLALEISRRHESLRPRKKDDPQVAELAGLCEKVRVLIERRTALVQSLKANLVQYYPGVLDFFGEWTSPVAWRFVKQFPRPQVPANTRKHTLIKFLKANRVGLKPVWLERIEARGAVARWPNPADSAALEMMAPATISELLALQPHIDRFDRKIAHVAPDLPQNALVHSLPGAGERLTPALVAITATAMAEQGGLQELRCISGVAPVQKTSGKHHEVVVRRRCNPHWRNTIHLFAFCSTNYCTWARAFYDMRRERGDTHAGALRKLGDKWVKIFHRMLETGSPYDERQYLDAMRRRNSPLYHRTCATPCG